MKVRLNRLFFSYIFALLVSLFYPVFVFTPVYLKNSGYSGTEIGVLSGCLYFAGLFFSIPAGVLADIISIRSITLSGFILFAGFPFLLKSSLNFTTVLTGYLLGAIGSVMVRTSADIFFLKIMNNIEKERFLKFGYFTGISGVGMAVSYLLTGYIINMGDFSLFFSFLLIFSLAGGIISLLIPSTPLSIEKPSYLKHFKSLLFLVFFLLILLHTMHFGAEVSSLGILLMKEIKLSSLQMGFALGGAMIFLGIGGFLGGYAGEKIKNGKMILLSGIVLSATGNIGLGLGTNFYSIMAYRVIHEIGDAFLFVGLRFSTSEFFSAEDIGGVWGGFRTSITLGSLFGSLLYGFILERMGPRAPFFVSGIVSFLACSLLLTFKLKRR